MMNSVNATTTASGADGGGPRAFPDSSAPAPAASPSPPPTPAPEGKRASDLRLTIEEDRHSGVFVYKLVDSVTGVVINEIPRERVQAMGQQPDYAAGAVVQTSA